MSSRPSVALDNSSLSLERLEDRRLLTVDVSILNDIYAGISSSYPGQLTNMGGTLYFTANDGTSGNELWRTDGTQSRTIRVKDIRTGSFDSNPGRLTNVGGTLYFGAIDSTSAAELWKSDGTEAGTVRVKDITAGSSSSSLNFLTNVAGTLYFVNGDLWKTDGTEAGTVRVKDIRQGSLASGVSYLTNVSGTLYFSADDGTSGPELWRSDGTESGTVRVRDIQQGIYGSQPRYLTNVGGTLYFTANDGLSGRELWKSDGTEIGTVRVKDIQQGFYTSNPKDLTNVSGTLFFMAWGGTTGFELWKSDGTQSGTVRLRESPGWIENLRNQLTNVGGTLFFVHHDDTSGIELWKSDGTESGTAMVKDIRMGSVGSSPLNLTNVSGTLYFMAAVDVTSGFRWWTSDATEQGTTIVANLSGLTSASSFVEFNGGFVFSAMDEEYGRELWIGKRTGDLIVDSVADEFDGNFASGNFSLREAIHVANFNPADRILFDTTGAFATPRTIGLTLGEIAIRGDLIILGTGADQLAIDAQGNSRVFRIDDGDDGQLSAVRVERLTLKGGAVSTGLSGGAIDNREDLIIDSVSISGSTANLRGGAIDSRGRLTITDTTLSGNTASIGGAIYDRSSAVSRIVNSTISGNQSTAVGGGLYHGPGVLVLSNSTITDNQALGGVGGGVVSWSDPDGILVTHTELDSTIVSGNVSGDVVFVNIVNTFVSSGYNLIGLGNGLSSFAAAGDMTGILDPRLGILEFNGGKTRTHALLPDSPARDRGNPELVPGQGGALRYDQRSAPFSRVFNGRIDVGAVEDQALLVDSATDENDDDYAVGDFSLREAVGLVNALPHALGIAFDTAHTFAAPATIFLTIGELEIREDLTIQGPGSDRLSIDGQGNVRLFRIDDENDTHHLSVIIQGLTIANGSVAGNETGGGILNRENLTLRNSVVSGNAAKIGGGIYHELGTLTIENSTVSNNETTTSLAGGGGIYAKSGAVIVNQSTISGNTAKGSGHGGGVSGKFSSVTVTNSAITDNRAAGSGNGGAIYSLQGNLQITSSTISGNLSLGGRGAIHTSDGNLTIDSSTISNNSSQLGGGVFSNTNLADQTTVIRNSTISGNTALLQGGGVYNQDGRTIIEYSTITDNGAPAGKGSGVFSYDGFSTRTEIRSSIIAGNENTDVDFLAGGSNSFYSQGYNLVGVSSLGAASALPAFSNQDVTGVANPLLGPLANNGGATLTHLPLVGSPALDRGNPLAVAGANSVPLTDQRGVSRVRGGRIDIGALEVDTIFALGDLNQDGAVDAADAGVMFGNWAQSGVGDLNSDGIVDAADAGILFGNWTGDTSTL